MQRTIVRTQLEKRKALHFLADDLQVWATYLNVKDKGQFGVRFIWMEDKFASSPLHHVTQDNGQSFHQYESYLMPRIGSLDMHITVQETNHTRLSRLHRIWTVYHQKLNEQEAN